MTLIQMTSQRYAENHLSCSSPFLPSDVWKPHSAVQEVEWTYESLDP